MADPTRERVGDANVASPPRPGREPEGEPEGKGVGPRRLADDVSIEPPSGPPIDRHWSARRTSLFLWRSCRVFSDLLSGLAAMAAVFLIRVTFELPFTESLLPADRLSFLATAETLVAATQNALLYFFGFYELARPRQRAERLRRIFTATSLQGLLFMGFYFLTGLPFPRTVILLFVPMNLFLLVATRLLLDRVILPPERSAAIVGVNPTATELAEDIERYHWHGLKVAGHVLPPTETETEDTSPCLGPKLGTIEDLPQLMSEGRFDEVIVASSQTSWQTDLVDQLSKTKSARGSILLLPSPFESLLGRMRYRSIHDVPLVEVVRESEWRARHPIKRAFDLIAASLLLLLTSPLMALCALSIKLTSPGPVFYTQTRIGREGRPFTLWKLRTMHIGAEDGTGEVLATPNDPRLTRVGRLLRSLRLDEIPQLFNVLRGTMSLVGPRPERPGFVDRYLEEVPGYASRFSIQPGVTGLAQVNGDYHSSPENKLRYELAYLANWSIWLDLSILIRTVKIILTSKGV